MFGELRWRSTWKVLGAQSSPELPAALISRYSEAGRYYHTLQHLQECFVWFDEAKELATHPAEVEVALWFHDALYDSHANDNEERSADWAHAVLTASGVAREAIHRIRDLILATKHQAAPHKGDASLIVDIDLAILGANEGRFWEYEYQVRQEYAWVPEAEFRQGRSRVLQQFLARAAIYSTAWFSDRLEAQARTNLEQSIAALA